MIKVMCRKFASEEFAARSGEQDSQTFCSAVLYPSGLSEQDDEKQKNCDNEGGDGNGACVHM